VVAFFGVKENMKNKKEKNKIERFFVRLKNDKKEFKIFILVILLLATNGLLINSYLKNEKVESFEDKYNFLNPAVDLIESHDLIVNFQSLRESLTSKYEEREDYLVSIYFEYLPTGANIAINKDEEVWPASLIKIPVAMAMMKKVESGKWNFDNELVILDEDKDNGFGTLYQQPTGTTMTIEKLLEESLIKSDNTAHLVLLRNLDSSEIEDIYNHLGMDDIVSDVKKKSTQDVDNRITAKRYSIFFRSLYNSTYLLPENSQKFLDILEKAPQEYLSLGLPAEVKFVHKTGVRVGESVNADAGIVYADDRPYLITVMIQKRDNIPESDNEKINQIFKDISEEIYNYVSTVE